MHWIVQENIFNERRYDDVISTLVRGQIPHTIIKVVPFSHELIPKPDVQNPIAVIGSYTLVKIAKSYGWGPGVFYNGEIDYQKYLPIFGNRLLLNDDAEIMRFGDVCLAKDMFIRPSDDGKGFTGQIFSPGPFKAWQQLVRENIGSSFGTVTEDTLVVVAEPKEIYAEYRMFVVDGKIVTGSRYMLGGTKSESEDVPVDVINFAQGVVECWQPDRAFVVDVAITPDHPRIIEFNNINAAGWYMANVSKIIQAIDGLQP